MGYGDHTNKAFTEAYAKYGVAVVKSMRRWKYGKVDDPEKLERLRRIGMARATYFYIHRAAGRVSVSLPIFTATAVQVFADSLKAINTGIAEVRKHYSIFISTLLQNGRVRFGWQRNTMNTIYFANKSSHLFRSRHDSIRLCTMCAQ